MNGYQTNIEKLTLENGDFRRVLFTGTHTQLVLMSLKPGEEIGEEIHDDVDQFFRFEAGQGTVSMDGSTVTVSDGDAVVITAGTTHNIINTSASEDLKLYTIYSPPNHPDKTVHKDKAEADEYERSHHSEGR